MKSSCYSLKIKVGGAIALVTALINLYGAQPPLDERPLTAFTDWVKQFKQTPAAQQIQNQSVTAEGLRLAEVRRQVLQQLIQEQPERALNLSLRWREWAALPAEVQAAVEEPFSEIADFEVIPDCRPRSERQTPWQVYRLRMRGTNYDAVVFGRRRAMTSKLKIPVQGILIGRTAVLWDAPVLPLNPEELPEVTRRFPERNAPARSWLSGRAIGAKGRAGLIGGRVHHFESDAELDAVSGAIAAAEKRFGPETVQRAWVAATQGETFDSDTFSEVAGVAESEWTETPKRLLCLRLDFMPVQGTPYTREQLLQTLAQSSDAIQVMSYDKTWIIPTVSTQVFVLTNSSLYYASAAGELADLADQLAAAAGYVLTNYDNFMYSYPGSWAAFAQVGGSRSWFSGFSGLPEVETHELGHNYGLWHANQWRPQTGTGLWPHFSPGDAGTPIEHREYGDPYDIMGGSTGAPAWADEHMNANMKAALNWIEPQEVAVASSNGFYRLYRFDEPSARANTGAKLALQIRNRENDEFWVSLRGAFGPNPLLANSAIIVWATAGPSQHELLDTTPLSVAGQLLDKDRDDCALRPGAAWTDPTGSFRIRNLGHGGVSPYDYLDLEVTHFPTLPPFEFFTTADQNVRGLVGSFVNGSLSSYTPHDDWRISQTIAGTRVDTNLSFPSNSWGMRADVGLTNGSDADWDDYSVQWDGYLAVHRAVRLKLSSGDGSRMWLDLDQNAAFAATAPEFMDNGWGWSQGERTSPPGATLPPGVYPVRIQYEAREGGVFTPNHFSLPTTPVDFEFFTTSNLTTPGITASFVNQSLSSYAPQDDWRSTQVISGSRLQDYPGQPLDGWGLRAAVGLTGGTDANWGLFAAQWDGWLRIHEPTELATVSDAGSRMWLDLDGDGLFSTNAPEFIDNNWGEFDQGAKFGENSSVIAPGTYLFRAQYDESVGFNSFMTVGRPASLSSWLAFNDCALGSNAHPDTTMYDILGIASPTNGPLHDVRSGDQLPVTLTITHSSTGVSLVATQGPAAAGCPLAAAFHGYVSFAGSSGHGAELTNAEGRVTYTFSGLNPAQRYSFKGSAVGPVSDDTNRWTLCELVSAENFQPAHSSARVLTTNQEPALNSAQAVLNTGGNHQPQTGDYVGWDNIQSGADGSFAVICQLYSGVVPGGLAGEAADALTGLRLEEFAGPPAPVGIVAAPLSYEILAGQQFALSVTATGTPLYYQWYKDYLPIPQANLPTLLVAGATTNDTGRYYVIVSNQFGSVASAVVSVGVYPDAITALFRIVPLANGVTNGPPPLRVTGVAAKGWVVVETSTNLTDWLPMLTNWSQFPTFDFTDISSSNRALGFYRATIPAAQPPPPNDLPSVAITYPPNDSSFPVGGALMVSASATDPDGLVTQVELFANEVSVAVDTTPPYEFNWPLIVVGSYVLHAVVTDNLGSSVTSAPVAVILTPPPPPPLTFFETNGLVVIEAEHFAQSSGSSSHAWTGVNDLAGYMNDMTMRTTPNIGTNITANITTTSPSLTYYVQFTNAGTYNLWIRGWATNGSDDSVYLGLNGQVLQTLNYSPTGAWMWRSKQIVIPSAARHEITIWMREDGAYVDRLLLSTNLAFTPTGDGPPEYAYPNENNPPSIYEWSPPSEDWPPGEPVTVAVGQPLSMFGGVEDYNGGIYTCHWISDLGPVETQTKLVPGLGWRGFSSRIDYIPTLADVGNRIITLTVQDSGGLTNVHVFNVTVTVTN